MIRLDGSIVQPPIWSTVFCWFTNRTFTLRQGSALFVHFEIWDPRQYLHLALYSFGFYLSVSKAQFRHTGLFSSEQWRRNKNQQMTITHWCWRLDNACFICCPFSITNFPNIVLWVGYVINTALYLFAIIISVYFIQIHSFVSAALLTATKPSYRVYFNRRRPATTTSSTPSVDDDDDYSLIVGIRVESLISSNQKIQVRALLELYMHTCSFEYPLTSVF